MNNVFSRYHDTPFRSVIHTAQNIQQSAFSAPRRSKNNDEFPCFQRKGNIVQCDYGILLTAVYFFQIPNFYIAHISFRLPFFFQTIFLQHYTTIV